MSNPSPGKQNESDIQRYVSTGEGAVAPCFVKDVLELKDAKIGDWGIWWLGTVPCRKVLLIGLIVGVIEYEKRVLYTLDDGTEVVDCLYQKPTIKPPPKPKEKGKAREVESKVEYLPLPGLDVGSTATVIGKVTSWRDGKQVVAESVVPCPSTDEPKHWTRATLLHKTKYSQPFTIPKVILPTTPSTKRIFSTLAQESGPSSRHSSPAHSIPAQSSPAKSSASTTFGSPGRLRHPLKISSSQLTTHTFRAHLVQYLIQASQPPPPPIRHHSSQEDPFYVDTPTPKRRRAASPERTPRPKGKQKGKATEGSPPGFSLSYLRRVPELDCLGRRVVRAEAKRRAKEIKLKEKEARHREREKERQRRSQSTKPSSSTSTSLASRSTPASSSPVKVSSERTSLKVKRLFQMTLRTLVADGSIVLADPPGRSWEKGTEDHGRRLCWRDLTNTTSSTIDPSSSTFLNATSTSTATSASFNDSFSMDMDEDPPSDPDTTYEEECYLPAIPHVLAEPVLKAMQKVIGPGAGRGATLPEMLSRLKKQDDKWMNLHDIHIEDTLQYLDEKQRVWLVGKDKWGLME